MAIIPCDDPTANASQGLQISTDWMPLESQVQSGVSWAGGQLTGTYDPAGGGAAPTRPTIAVAELTTTSVRVTITGDAGVTNFVEYCAGLNGTWQAGGNRSGDGTKDITGLTAGATYYFGVYAADGGYNSPPSKIEGLTLSGGAVLTVAAGLLEESIAAAATFRTWTGTGDATAAKARIHLWEVAEADLTDARPTAVITVGGDYHAERIAYGSGDQHQQTGELQLTLEAEYDTTDTVTNNINDFAVTTGKIVNEILAVSGRGGYLAIAALHRIDGPGLANEDEVSRIVAETYSVRW